MKPEKWIRNFFGNDNKWGLDEILEGNCSPDLQVQLEFMLRRALTEHLPNVLPRQCADGQHWFYIIGSNIREHRELIRVLEAHLGSVAVQFDPRIYTESINPGEAALLEKHPHGFSKFSIPTNLLADSGRVRGVYQDIYNALDRYSFKPANVSTFQRPISRILRDFIVACNQGDGESAYDLYEEAAATEALSTINLISLELQVFETNAYWQKILDYPQLQDILNGRISGVVSDLILKAVSNVILKSDNIRDYERDSLQIEFRNIRPLFLRNPELSHSSSASNWKAWAVGAVVCDYAKALQLLPEEIVGKEWIQELAQWGRLEQPAIAPVNQMDTLIDEEPSLPNAAILLKMLDELNSRDQEAIHKVLLEYPGPILDKLAENAFLTTLWETLKKTVEPQEDIEGWASYLKKLSSGSDTNLDPQAIRELSRHWSSDDWNEEEILDSIYELEGSQNSSRFRNVIPVLQEWMRDNKKLATASFIEQIIVVLASDELFSAQDLVLFSDLIDDLANTAHSETQYQDSVACALGCWEKIKSVHSLNVGLEQMEILLDSPCLSPQARTKFWNSVQDYCLANWKRLSDTQRFVIHQIAEVMSGSVAHLPPLKLGQDSETEFPRVEFENKKLAIYTLTKGAGERASVVLENMFPGLQVSLNYDKNATDALVNLAKTADYFIFASRSAKHQAFYPVTKHREDILYPSGKGSSSIVQCFLSSMVK